MFLVVEFTDGNEIAMIPDNWLDGNKYALWPPFKRTDRIHKAVRAKEIPTDSWRAYPIRELYENYDKVRKKVKVAEDESDLQTVDSGEDDDVDLARRSKRRRKLPDTYSPDTSDDEVVNRPVHKSTKTVTASQPPLPVPLPVLQTQQSSLCVQPPISPMPFCSPPRQQLIRASTEARPCIISPPRGESTPTHSTSINRARDIRMFTSVEQLREEVAQQRPILDAILRAVNHLGLHEYLDQGLPEGINFPLATLEDVDSLEHELTDATTFKIVINYLAPIGGKDERTR